MHAAIDWLGIGSMIATAIAALLGALVGARKK